MGFQVLSRQGWAVSSTCSEPQEGDAAHPGGTKQQPSEMASVTFRLYEDFSSKWEALRRQTSEQC